MWFTNILKSEIFPDMDVNQMIKLRSLHQDDAEEYFKYMNAELMKHYITSDNIPNSIIQSIEEINYWKNLFIKGTGIYWAIALKESNQIIGSVGFNSISCIHQSAEIGYDLNPKFWNQGIMSQTIIKIQNYAKSNLEIKQIIAKVNSHNYPSIKLLTKLSFIKSQKNENHSYPKHNINYIIYRKLL